MAIHKNIFESQIKKFGYQQKLSRELNLLSLTSFGLTYLQPIGPAVVFGYLLNLSGGTVALPYLLAFVGMLFTVFSYSVLIKEFPLAGSVYNYIKLVVSPFWGFIAGWLLALDYILIPTITSASASIYAHYLFPMVSYHYWLLLFVTLTSFLNLIGIKIASLINSVLLMIQLMIVVTGFVLWVIYMVKTSGSYGALLDYKPFQYGSLSGVLQASSLAIFSFLGFDAVTTLAEESVDPRKDIPRAMLICTCIGFAIMFVTGYLGVLLLPNWKILFHDQGWLTATLFNVNRYAGGSTFSFIYSIGFILAMVVTNLVGMVAATRLLYGMGRDGVIPKVVFSKVNDKWKTPHGGIIFLAITEILLGYTTNPDTLAELINFGALAAFIMLNVGLIIYITKPVLQDQSFFKKSANGEFTSIVTKLIPPVVAVFILGLIFINMKSVTILFGLMWLGLGIFWQALNYRKSRAMI